jgi:hypothetical protein
MEIREIISYYIYEDTKRMEISFRLTIDSEDEVRNDIINLDDSKEFGYDLVENSFDFFDMSEYEDIDDDDDFFDDEFPTIDEDILISFLNEYYIVNPDKLPRIETF